MSVLIYHVCAFSTLYTSFTLFLQVLCDILPLAYTCTAVDREPISGAAHNNITVEAETKLTAASSILILCIDISSVATGITTSCEDEWCSGSGRSHCK